MKIAILTEVLNPRSGSRVSIELAKKLAKNHQVLLFAYKLKVDRASKEGLEKIGIKVILIPAVKIPFLGRYISSLYLLKALKKHQVDILSFHGTLPFFLAAKLSNIPLIKTYYGTQLDAYLERLSPEQKPNLKDQFLNWLGNQLILFTQRIYFSLSNQVVAISQYTSDEAEKLYKRKISFIYLGGDSLSTNYPAEDWLAFGQQLPKNTSDGGPNTSGTPQRWRGKDQRHLRGEKACCILSVSRITPYKGFHLLIKAFKDLSKKFPKAKLLIVGSTPKKEYLKLLKKIKSKNVKILVNISDEKLSLAYQECDIYASCDRYLFFGLPPVEAAYFEKPSVALNFAAAPEIIEHGQTGFLATSLSDLTKHLVELAQDKTLRKNMGQKAKKRAKKLFSWDKTAQEYEKLFKDVIVRFCSFREEGTPSTPREEDALKVKSL